ncbi:hypothetical protein PORCAN_2084 [Porphyromonas crevioricanis JCM 13913]|nr:hypothetical protein PORCAN_2084 [Porphyromonas crevioricanis JCM 13913]
MLRLNHLWGGPLPPLLSDILSTTNSGYRAQRTKKKELCESLTFDTAPFECL